MIPSNIVSRVYKISYRDSQGTAFTIEVDGKQYLVTASHVVEGIQQYDEIGIFVQGGWLKRDVTVFHCEPEECDTTVLCPGRQISQTLPVELGQKGLAWSQEVFFLGFPLGQHSFIGVMGGVPLAFVKKAIVSNVTERTEDRDVQRLWLDGHANRGFSGGPVVAYSPSNRHHSKIVGVVSGYQAENILAAGTEAEAPFETNAGLVIAHSIEHALRCIEQNPKGFPAESV